MELEELIELGDSDELLREIDRLCHRHAWPELLRLRDLCRAATERGKQLWGAAGHAEYRLALEATPEFAAPMVEADPGRFVLGPLTEVVASSHTWSALAPHLPPGPLAAAVAYERVLHGEDLSANAELRERVDEFGLPFVLQSWEPQYATAQYKSHELLAPAPAYEVESTVSVVADNQTADEIEDPTVDALYALVQPWLSGSNGAVRIAAVAGGLTDALAQFGATTASRLEADDALAWMAWAAAAGGAHGVRSGAGAGRSKLWSLLSSLADVNDQWPYPSNELGRVVSEVEWWTWDHDDINEGWTLRLAIVDRETETTFAIDAFDRPD